MNFIKVGLSFAASTGTRLITNLLAVKVIALYVGSDGLGKLGQFMSVMSMVTTLAGGGIYTGLLKYVAEFRENAEEIGRYLSSSSMIALTSSIIAAVFLVVFAGQISLVLLGTTKYADIIYVLALVQFPIGANNLVLSIINGYQDVRGYALVSIAGAIAGAGILSTATALGGLHGSMYGLILMPASMALFSIPYVFHRRRVTLAQLLPRYDREVSVRLLNYTLMLCVTVSTMPLAQIILRKMIEKYADWSAVGYWQGICKLSDAYLMFILMVLSNYYLPRLSSSTNNKEVVKEVLMALRIVLPVTAAMSFAVYLLRDTLITLLFSKSFGPMREYFMFQMIGDFFKICAYTIGYVAVSKAMTKIYICAEIFQSFMFVALSSYILKVSGPVGITYAYALNYFLYFGLALATFYYYIVRFQDA